jgi:pyruvate/2-oxoglutarate dehydrogenase complex dihydrolipoamide dehydrogenase (E3) component
VDIVTGVKLEAITPAGVEITDKNGVGTLKPCATIVLALGMQPRSRDIGKYERLAPDVYVIGDCHNQRGNLYSAVSEGFFAAMEI